jgi:hypothetical protein
MTSLSGYFSVVDSFSFSSAQYVCPLGRPRLPECLVVAYRVWVHCLDDVLEGQGMRAIDGRMRIIKAWM